MALAALYLEDESLDKYVKYTYTLLLERRDLRLLLLMSLPRAGTESVDAPLAAAPATSTATATSTSASVDVGSATSAGSAGGIERPTRGRDDEQLTRAEALVMLLQHFLDRTADVQSAIALALTLLDAAALLYDPLHQRLQSPAGAFACPPRLHNIAHTVASWIEEYDTSLE